MVVVAAVEDVAAPADANTLSCLHNIVAAFDVVLVMHTDHDHIREEALDNVDVAAAVPPMQSRETTTQGTIRHHHDADALLLTVQNQVHTYDEVPSP